MPSIKDEAKCVGCGCTDSESCKKGCWWRKVNYFIGYGVCSRCDSEENRKKLDELQNEAARLHKSKNKVA